MKTCNKKILLSFIIPVYNVEKYLQKCVDSVLAQATEECEIILVNDGSTDSSGEICLQYAEKSHLVKVINNKNGGLSFARNAGIMEACGEYITFIDSDDLIFSNSIAHILNWIRFEGTDMCFLQALKLYPDGTCKDIGESIARIQLKGKSREESINHLTSRPKYPGSAWAKLYNREFLINNDLHFPYDRRYSEDLGFVRDCIMCARDFDALEIPYYQYRQNRQGSITNRITYKNFQDLFCFIKESVEKLTENRKAINPVSSSMMRAVAYEFSVLMYLINYIPRNEKKDALWILNEYKWTLKYAGNRKLKFVFLLCCLLGIRLTAFAMNCYREAVKK